MKKLLFSFYLVFSLTSCGQQRGDIKVVDPDKFEELIGSNNNKVILDVRTPDEVKGGIIRGAMAIDFYSDTFEEDLAKLDKDKTYFVYCAGGVRSNKAAQVMTKIGFTQIFDLKGGMGAWQGAGKPVDQSE